MGKRCLILDQHPYSETLDTYNHRWQSDGFHNNSEQTNELMRTWLDLDLFILLSAFRHSVEIRCRNVSGGKKTCIYWGYILVEDQHWLWDQRKYHQEHLPAEPDFLWRGTEADLQSDGQGLLPTIPQVRHLPGFASESRCKVTLLNDKRSKCFSTFYVPHTSYSPSIHGGPLWLKGWFYLFFTLFSTYLGCCHLGFSLATSRISWLDCF